MESAEQASSSIWSSSGSGVQEGVVQADGRSVSTDEPIPELRGGAFSV